MGFLTSRTIAPTVTTNDLVHIVITGDTSQGNPSGSSYKATIGQIGLAISTGNTITISGGTDISVTGSHPNFVISFTGTTSGDYLPLSGGTVSGGTIFTSGITANTISATTYLNLPTYYNSTGITTSQSITWDKTYWGISGLTNVDITLPSTTSKDGYILIVKDEGGNAGTYRIRVTPLSGLIDGNTYIDMNINYMSLTFVARNNNWWII
jgi:hypothetical protein